MQGVHRHGPGWRGTFSVSTKTYASEQEAAAALADLKARIQSLKNKERDPQGPALDPLGGRREPHMIPANYPRPVIWL